jgi:hypothetical protein
MKIKNIFLFCFILFSNFTIAQITIDYRNCTVENSRTYVPAPCDISGNGQQTNLFMIQVGAYRNFINPKPGIIVVPSSLLNTVTNSVEIIYRYYIAAIFPNEQEAQQHIVENNLKNTYCDAMVVPFPFSGVIAYN